MEEKSLNCVIYKQQGIESGFDKFVERHEKRSKERELIRKQILEGRKLGKTIHFISFSF
jgi:hypothetical protein